LKADKVVEAMRGRITEQVFNLKQLWSNKTQGSASFHTVAC